MRVHKQGRTISVRAIAGTNVVLLGLDAKPEVAEKLVGFTIKRTSGDKEKWLSGGKIFAGTEAPEGLRTDSRTAPIQAFLWGDYEAAPGTKYRYSITAKYGSPDAMEDGETVRIDVATENPDEGVHGVFFNRGVAGSQAYARMFDKYRRYYLTDKRGRAQWKDFIKPDQIPGLKAWDWLSRGLKEAVVQFIRQADGPRYSIRAAVYEFDYLPVVAEFAAALETGADVQIVHHAKRTTHNELKRGGKTVTSETLDPITVAAKATIREVGIKDWANTSRWQGAFFERKDTTISHNKFIVLMKDGHPVSVWTGSTNFTAGGIFGQSNVGHVIRDKDVAARYLAYWEKLKTDPPRKKASDSPEEMGIQDWNIHAQADLTGPPPRKSITTIFSPRPTTGMLQWYADRLAEATSSIHFTAAFGVSKQIARKLVTAPKDAPESFLRYVMLESLPPKPRKGEGETTEKAAAKTKAKGKGAGKTKPAETEEQPIADDFEHVKAETRNRIAWGDLTRATRSSPREGARMAAESLSGLNVNVEFLHTKYLLIDPLTDDPIVVTGSANFSDNSTTMNDENMVIVRGDTRLADVFLTEFMRLFNHFRGRNEVNLLRPSARSKASQLATDGSWTQPYYTPGTQQYAERLLFH
jgi:phosphatidylserine/phosphatidylglycerophosphate/cardiolipin synthase-like enzyme